jgi:hypothetical protein
MLIPESSVKVCEAGFAALESLSVVRPLSLSGVISRRELDAIGCGGRFKYACFLPRVEAEASSRPLSVAVLGLSFLTAGKAYEIDCDCLD